MRIGFALAMFFPSFAYAGELRPGVSQSLSISTVTASQCLRTDSTGSAFQAGDGCGPNANGITNSAVVDGALTVGTGANVSTISAGGAVTLAAGAALALSGSAGTILNRSSITASAFFGDGANLTGIAGAPANAIKGEGAVERLAVFDTTGTLTTSVYATHAASMNITGGGGLTLTYGLSAATAVFTGAVQHALGSLTAPSINFGDADTGFYAASSGADIRLTKNGTFNWELGSQISAQASTNQIATGGGTAGGPGYTFLSDSNTGIYSGLSDTMYFVTGGVSRIGISNANTTALSSFTVTGNAFSVGGSTFVVNAGTITVGGTYFEVGASTAILSGNYNYIRGRTDGSIPVEWQVGYSTVIAINPLTRGLGPTNTGVSITTITLPAGIWDLDGICALQAGATTATTMIGCAISTTNDGFDTAVNFARTRHGTVASVSQPYWLNVGPRRVRITANTTYYLVGEVAYSVDGGASWDIESSIRAERVQ